MTPFLIKNNEKRKGQNFITGRELHRARLVLTADAAKALLAKMEDAGLLNGEDTAPAHGGRATRIYRAVNNPVQA